SFRVERPEDVERFKVKFEEQGIEVLELPVGHETGRGAAIRFLVPFSEHPFEFYYDIERGRTKDESIRSKLPTSSSTRRGLGVRRMDHVNIQTDPGTINQTEGWLREHLGIKRREFIMMPDSP